MSIILIEYKIEEYKLISDNYEKVLNKCFEKNATFTKHCFKIMFYTVFYYFYKNNDNKAVFLAMMDGFSLDYHKKSYQKLINNLESIVKNKI